MNRLIKFFVLLLLLLVSAEAGAADASYERALRQFKSGDYRNVVVYLEKYVIQRPDPAAYYMLGYAFYELHEFHKSKEYFDAVFLIDPDFTYDKIIEHSLGWDEELKLISEVLEMSGAKNLINYFTDLVGTALREVQGPPGEERIRTERSRLVKENFRSEIIYSSVVQVFHNRFNRAYLSSVREWLRGPVGQRMIKLDKASRSPEGMERARTFGGEYQKLGDSRKSLLIRFEKAISATDMNMDVVSVSLIEMLTAMQSQVSGRNRMSTEQFDAIVGKIRNMPRDRLRSKVIISLACTYRDFTDEELENAINFYEGPAGKWFKDTSIRAISSGMGKVSREVGEKIGECLMAKNIPV